MSPTHLDYFRDIHHIVSSFKEFAALVPKDGYVLDRDSGLPFELFMDASRNVIRVYYTKQLETLRDLPIPLGVGVSLSVGDAIY